MKQTRLVGLLCALILGVLTGFWAGSGTGMDLSAYLIQAGAAACPESGQYTQN